MGPSFSLIGIHPAQVGDLYHGHDFKRGSLMPFCGYPAWKVIGLTCIGDGRQLLNLIRWISLIIFSSTIFMQRD
jgi:hypothetical protein